MPTFWELITESSTLPEENDLWDHLNNLGEGGSGTVINVVGDYDIAYVGEEARLIVYTDSDPFTVTYTGEQTQVITYTGEQSQVITYIEKDDISLEFLCR